LKLYCIPGVEGLKKKTRAWSPGHLIFETIPFKPGCRVQASVTASASAGAGCSIGEGSTAGGATTEGFLRAGAFFAGAFFDDAFEATALATCGFRAVAF
jgi:hypothetical protein